MIDRTKPAKALLTFKSLSV